MRYRIFAPEELDDLVMIAVSNRLDWLGTIAAGSIERWLDSGPFRLERVTSSPAGDEVMLLEDLSAASPGAIITLVPRDGGERAFAYLTSGGVELHIPERYLFSGATETDGQRLSMLTAWLGALQETLHISWDRIVSADGDSEVPTGALLETITSYHSVSRSRLEVEPVD